MKNEEVPRFDPNILQALDGSDPDKIIKALLITVLYSENYDLAVTSTKRFTSHPNEHLRGIAIECISHISRLWRNAPDDLIQVAVNSLKDTSKWVQEKAGFTLDDLEIYLKAYKRPPV